eukprot:GHVT01014316.1.p1 GENE.GHVT01014316.1~~GHVT01014316.1.p1  ORF type:complete len:272 (+),score=48.74 GHVT01014316.1:746-1561(+)
MQWKSIKGNQKKGELKGNAIEARAHAGASYVESCPDSKVDFTVSTAAVNSVEFGLSWQLDFKESAPHAKFVKPSAVSKFVCAKSLKWDCCAVRLEPSVRPACDRRLEGGEGMTLNFVLANLTGTEVEPLFFSSPLACLPSLAFFLRFRNSPAPTTLMVAKPISPVIKMGSKTWRLDIEDSSVSGRPDSELLGSKDSPVSGRPGCELFGLEDSPVSGRPPRPGFALSAGRVEWAAPVAAGAAVPKRKRAAQTTRPRRKSYQTNQRDRRRSPR